MNKCQAGEERRGELSGPTSWNLCGAPSSPSCPDLPAEQQVDYLPNTLYRRAVSGWQEIGPESDQNIFCPYFASFQPLSFPYLPILTHLPFPHSLHRRSSVDLRRGAACQLSQLTISSKLLPPPTTWSMLGWASSNQLPWAHPSPWSCSSSENHRGPFDKQWSDDWENKTSRRMMIRSPSSCGQWTQKRTIFWFSNRDQNKIERCLALGDEDLIKFCTRRLRLQLLSYSGEKIICK